MLLAAIVSTERPWLTRFFIVGFLHALSPSPCCRNWIGLSHVNPCDLLVLAVHLLKTMGSAIFLQHCFQMSAANPDLQLTRPIRPTFTKKPKIGSSGQPKECPRYVCFSPIVFALPQLSFHDSLCWIKSHAVMDTEILASVGENNIHKYNKKFYKLLKIY